MPVPHEKGVPDIVPPPEVEQETDDGEQIAQERGEDGWAHDGMKALDVKDVHRARHDKAAGRERHAADHVKGEPTWPIRMTPGSTFGVPGRFPLQQVPTIRLCVASWLGTANLPHSPPRVRCFVCRGTQPFLQPVANR